MASRRVCVDEDGVLGGSAGGLPVDCDGLRPVVVLPGLRRFCEILCVLTEYAVLAGEFGWDNVIDVRPMT